MTNTATHPIEQPNTSAITMVPDHVVAAIVGLLLPHFPDLTAEQFLAVLNRLQAGSCMPDTPVLDKHTACKHLNISIATLNRMLRDKQLSSVRIRGSVRIPADAVQRLLQPEPQL
jgi:excisionase family DNA binding protein